MNQAVGTICDAFSFGGGHSGAPSVAVNGPWLNNAPNHRRGQPYLKYGKTSDMVRPGPAMTWLLIDADAESLNDAGFGVGMMTAEWIDWPGTYRNYACGSAFADGHSEIQKWKAPRTKVGGLRGPQARPRQCGLALDCRTYLLKASLFFKRIGVRWPVSAGATGASSPCIKWSVKGLVPHEHRADSPCVSKRPPPPFRGYPASDGRAKVDAGNRNQSKITRCLAVQTWD